MKKDKTNDCCPNCGHCPHCGRSDRQPPMIPAPYPVPVPMRPYRYWYYGEPKVYSGGDSNVIPRFGGQTISINASATC
jgi:hypothetical protein